MSSIRTSEVELVPAKVPPTPPSTSLTIRQRRKGGRTTFQRHGSRHMVAVGARGGKTTLENHGLAHYHELGKRGGPAMLAKYGREVMTAIGRYGGEVVRNRVYLDHRYTKLAMDVGTDLAAVSTEGERCLE